MTTAASTDDAVELDAVLDWRLTILVEAGYPYPEAFTLAAHPDVDLHTAVYLAETGCDHNTALRILL